MGLLTRLYWNYVRWNRMRRAKIHLNSIFLLPNAKTLFGQRIASRANRGQCILTHTNTNTHGNNNTTHCALYVNYSRPTRARIRKSKRADHVYLTIYYALVAGAACVVYWHESCSVRARLFPWRRQKSHARAISSVASSTRVACMYARVQPQHQHNSGGGGTWNHLFSFVFICEYARAVLSWSCVCVAMDADLRMLPPVACWQQARAHDRCLLQSWRTGFRFCAVRVFRALYPQILTHIHSILFCVCECVCVMRISQCLVYGWWLHMIA